MLVIVVYQQIEIYLLQPTILCKAADVLGFSSSRASSSSELSSAR